jgi:hypothetical protein
MALKKKKKKVLAKKKKKTTVKVAKSLKKTSKAKSKSSPASRTGKKTVAASKAKPKKQKSQSKEKKVKLSKTADKKTKLKKQIKSSEKPKKIIKEVKKNTRSHNPGKRKILELKKELDNLNNKNKEAVLIKDAEGRLYCRDESCDQPAVTDVYCRYHYLALWKYHQTRKKLLNDQFLMNTIQGLIKSFGTGVVSFMLYDFKNEKAFELVAKEMNFSTGKEEEGIPSETEANF